MRYEFTGLGLVEQKVIEAAFIHLGIGLFYPLGDQVNAHKDGFIMSEGEFSEPMAMSAADLEIKIVQLSFDQGWSEAILEEAPYPSLAFLVSREILEKRISQGMPPRVTFVFQ